MTGLATEPSRASNMEKSWYFVTFSPFPFPYRVTMGLPNVGVQVNRNAIVRIIKSLVNLRRDLKMARLVALSSVLNQT